MSGFSLAWLWLCLLFTSKATGKGGHVAALSHRRPCERQAIKGGEGGKEACDFWLCLSPFLLHFCRGTGCRAGCNAHLLGHFEKGTLEGTKESRGKRRAHGKDFVLRGTLHGWWRCEVPHGPWWNVSLKTPSKDTYFLGKFLETLQFPSAINGLQLLSSKLRKKNHRTASLNFV